MALYPRRRAVREVTFRWSRSMMLGYFVYLWQNPKPSFSQVLEKKGTEN